VRAFSTRALKPRKTGPARLLRWKGRSDGRKIPDEGLQFRRRVAIRHTDRRPPRPRRGERPRPASARDHAALDLGLHAAGRPRREPAAAAMPAVEDNGDRVQRELAMLTSPQMREILSVIEQAARADVTVLVCGETGVGKELVARAIHAHSPRRRSTFVKVNCAAMPRELLESELFGHERGAFTGAHQRKPGRFELADGGTIFLDEIGELHPALQAKLLHVLQDGEFSRVGGRHNIRVDVRVICATNRDLAREVAASRFREDLFYRLNVINILVPPLRERREEIPALVDYFVRRYSRLFNFPEREVICRALEQCRWNRVKTAKMLKISYRALLYKIKDMGLKQDSAAS